MKIETEYKDPTCKFENLLPGDVFEDGQGFFWIKTDKPDIIVRLSDGLVSRPEDNAFDIYSTKCKMVVEVGEYQ